MLIAFCRSSSYCWMIDFDFLSCCSGTVLQCNALRVIGACENFLLYRQELTNDSILQHITRHCRCFDYSLQVWSIWTCPDVVASSSVRCRCRILWVIAWLAVLWSRRWTVQCGSADSRTLLVFMRFSVKAHLAFISWTVIIYNLGGLRVHLMMSLYNRCLPRSARALNIRLQLMEMALYDMIWSTSRTITVTASHVSGYAMICLKTYMQVMILYFIRKFSTFIQYKKVKFSHTHYRVLGPELILLYRQSSHRWLF